MRKEIRVKPGYKPPEDVEVYKNRTANAFRNRGKGGVPGAEAAEEKAPLTAAAGKNAKRRESRKKAAAAGEIQDDGGEGGAAESGEAVDGQATKAEEPVVVDPEAEKAKEARKLAKKLRQARELKDRLASVIKIQELIRQLDNLGFDAEGQKKGGLEKGAGNNRNAKEDSAAATS